MSQSTILVVAPRDAADTLITLLQSAGYRTITAHSAETIVEAVYENPPHCLLLACDEGEKAALRVLNDLKSDNLYGHIPAVLVLSQGEQAHLDWTRVRADDYVLRPVSEVELCSRVGLCLARAQRDINANPLTGLPGNITIMREAENRLRRGEPFAMAYLDLDNFKPFNDKYGFGRGDEVLRMTARLLVNAVRALQSSETYVGHVGGDDFVYITPSDLMERTCQEVIRNFDLVIPNFYDEDDRLKGCIESVDRQNNAQVFPLMTCSIAVVDTRDLNISHLADIGARSAQVKKFAKRLPGSNYVVDRRR